MHTIRAPLGVAERAGRAAASTESVEPATARRAVAPSATMTRG